MYQFWYNLSEAAVNIKNHKLEAVFFNMMRNKHKGSTLDSFLEEESLQEKTEAIAIKRVIAYQLELQIKKGHLNKTEIAKRIGTSRSALDRLLDPSNTSVTLNTLVKVAHFIGKKLHVEFVP